MTCTERAKRALPIDLAAEPGALRREQPQRERPFRVPGGDVIPFLALYSSNLIVYWAGWDTNWKLFVAILIGFALLGLFYATGKGDAPSLDLRHGWWTLPWLGGLALISYLGSYPEKSEHKGNLAAISFGWGFIVVFVLTALVYLGLRSRLPRAKVEQYVQDARQEADADRKVLEDA